MAGGDKSLVEALPSEHGQPERCPHCGSVSAVEPSRALRFRCRVCGGPRVVVDEPAVERSEREVASLKNAHHQHLRVAAWGLGATLAGSVGFLSLFVALAVLLLVSPGLLTTLATLGMVAVPFVVAALAYRRARRHKTERSQALDRAWSVAAEDVLKQRGEEVNAADLGKIMHLKEAQAEQLLALLHVDDFLRSRVTDDGDLVYSTQLGRPRVRVDAGRSEAAAGEQESLESEPSEAQLETQDTRRKES